LSVNIDDFAILGNKLFAVSSATGFSGWYYADIPDSLEPPVWTKIVTPDTNGKLRPIGNMAYQVVDTEVFWVDAILCNSATVSDVNPFAIYVDPRDNLVKVKEWTNTFPDDENGTSDSMPRAGRCTMWGDFLVLGDIIWKADPDQSFDNSNKSRYSHGLWFSIPGKTDTWDPIDTVFTGQKAGANVVQGLYPLEPGLMVITCTLVALLQGSPDDFIYRELREGISNCGRAGNAAWPAKGGVVWNDRQGYVWFSNGEIFQRLDEAVVIEGRGAVAAVGEYVFVSTPSDTYVFRLYGEGGGWTRLTGTFGFNKIVANQRFLFGLEAREAQGSFILDSETNGLLDGDDLLWDADRLMTAFDFLEEKRGRFNNRSLRSLVRSRPLPGFGHNVRFWHRYGVRAKGDGKVLSATSRPSADPAERGYVTRTNGDLRRRGDYIFDAHGPSFEATFDVEFDGDVTVEHMTVWEHGGRLEK
jgi:hypothetical protein